jgi:beta-phosphoglucomutase-like phosphatase (HAD superfamily)
VKKTRQNKNFDLIIFDCDGVLVDSEVISCRAHAEVLTHHGYPSRPIRC